ncbi:MAG: DUF2505 domain-containing protein [Byssovorax sp.]
MGKFTVTHEINTTVEGFWKLFFDKEFNEKLYLEGLGFPEYKTLEQNDTDAQITRKVRGTPKMNMPGPVAKLMGSNFSYVEDGTFDKASKVWKWKLTPSTLADKMTNTGSVRVEAVGDTRVRRVADLLIEAKIFGLGGLIESSAEKQLRDGWDQSAVFMNKYIAAAK